MAWRCVVVVVVVVVTQLTANPCIHPYHSLYILFVCVRTLLVGGKIGITLVGSIVVTMRSFRGIIIS